MPATTRRKHAADHATMLRDCHLWFLARSTRLHDFRAHLTRLREDAAGNPELIVTEVLAAIRKLDADVLAMAEHVQRSLEPAKKKTRRVPPEAARPGDATA